MAINFSRSASQIVGQYYVLMRNGFEGFKEIQERTLDVARYLPPSSRRWASSRSTRTRRIIHRVAGR